jgi:hypothetical protein
MANKQCRVSYQVSDVDGVPASIPFYFLVPEATTLTLVQTTINALTVLLDAMLGAEIIGIEFVMDTTIVGAKGAPVAGSQVELTALQSWIINGVNNRTYGIDLAGALASKFDFGVIPDTDVDAANLDVWLAAPVNGFISTDEVFQALVAQSNLFSKTFRKRRKSLNNKVHKREP